MIQTSVALSFSCVFKVFRNFENNDKDEERSQPKILMKEKTDFIFLILKLGLFLNFSMSVLINSGFPVITLPNFCSFFKNVRVVPRVS